MNKSTLAGAALIAAAAVTVPVIAWSAGDGDQAQQPQQQQQWAPQGGRPGMGGNMGGNMAGNMGGPMMHHGWMGRMMRGDRSPQQACEDRVARRAGFVAYIGVKLNLTAEQKPLWDKLLAATQAAQDKDRQLCASLKPMDQRGQETVLDKVSHREQMLSTKLQNLQQVQPALQALYQALNPQQKAVLDHPFDRG
ncbi:MAG TPA: Spy/CpxP family protein refolding chaperone [Stellaceae bacterium]|nr:Spy/CpxP family protein refolding chaperone [Stellaceae bacterium]